METTTNTSITHTYSSTGVYILRLKGTASNISFFNVDANQRITKISSVVQGINGLTSFQDTFRNCTNLTGSIPVGLFNNCPDVTTFEGTFYLCTGLTGSIPSGLFDNNTHVTNFFRTFSTSFFGLLRLSEVKTI